MKESKKSNVILFYRAAAGGEHFSTIYKMGKEVFFYFPIVRPARSRILDFFYFLLDPYLISKQKSHAMPNQMLSNGERHPELGILTIITRRKSHSLCCIEQKGNLPSLIEWNTESLKKTFSTLLTKSRRNWNVKKSSPDLTTITIHAKPNLRREQGK
jgi:hypothetical protein